MKSEKLLVLLDLEGPEVLNDNAFETIVELAKLCGLGEEVGRKLYQRMSVIDDVWGDFHRIPKDPSYSSGHTLKVVLPFFKAMGATREWLYDFARQNLRIVPNIKEVLTELQTKYEVYIISTSYSWFVKAYCDAVGFPFKRAYCTRVRGFDQIHLWDYDRKLLLDFIGNVALMPVIEYNPKTGKVKPECEMTYLKMTDFVWNTLYHMQSGRLLRTVHPVGQTQKLEVARKIRQATRTLKMRTMYVGDSQTDVQVVKWLKDSGLTLMFNGKGKVCSLAHLMYIGEDARAMLEVADYFAQGGQTATFYRYLPPWEAKCGGIIASVTKENIQELEAQSVAKRKAFRGVAIGELT